jgi:hypothetical protein
MKEEEGSLANLDEEEGPLVQVYLVAQVLAAFMLTLQHGILPFTNRSFNANPKRDANCSVSSMLHKAEVYAVLHFPSFFFLQSHLLFVFSHLKCFSTHHV